MHKILTVCTGLVLISIANTYNIKIDPIESLFEDDPRVIYPNKGTNQYPNINEDKLQPPQIIPQQPTIPQQNIRPLQPTVPQQNSRPLQPTIPQQHKHNQHPNLPPPNINGGHTGVQHLIPTLQDKSNSSKQPSDFSNVNLQHEPTDILTVEELSLETVKKGIQELAFDIQSMIIEPINTIISPLSISSLLSVLSLGTKSHTKQELILGLHFDNPDILNYHQDLKTLYSNILKPNRGIELNSATRLYIRQDAQIYRTYTQSAMNYYNIEVAAADFLGKPHKTITDINRWVSDQTKGKIKNLLSNSFDLRNTQFIAINTLYFNGIWETQFDKHFTTNKVFQSPTRNITMPFMIQIMPVYHVYDRITNSDIVGLPYTGAEFAMFFLIPRGESNHNILTNIESQFDAYNFDELLKGTEVIDASVQLPRMRLSFKSSMKKIFKNLRIEEIFNPSTADFSNMSSTKPLYMDDIIHETVVEINESGTEAAAVTSTSLNRIGTNKVFIINKPVIAFIRDMKNGINLFYGSIVDPEPLL